MRGADRLQKILYLIMILLGLYILYKGGGILLRTPAAQDMLDSGELQRGLEDNAVRTWAPGYTAAMENHQSSNWSAGWMQQVAPVYSYLAKGEAETAEEETVGSETAEGNEIAAGEMTGTDAAGNETAEKETAGQMETQDGLASKALGKDAAERETVQQEDWQGIGTDKPVSAEDDLPASSMALASSMAVSPILLEQLRDFDYLISNYYTVDGGTVADEALLDVDEMLNEDLTLEKNPDVPQMLIYHTHSQEAFADSQEGKKEDTIVGMGEVLAELLREEYGYNVIHDTGVYDLVDGVLDRSTAYDYARASIETILQENPSIEVVIDLHRDGVEGQKFATEIDGRPTSMIMFFNGISRDSQDQPISYLQNPYTKQNLAFSLQMQLAAREQYPGFTRNIYLKAERFNLHLRPRSLLIEAGTQLNTVEEERNAMIPLADLLDQVLSGKK
ncbi:MAG: stage II sporulation protein P [Lachnospiraceae bacterium]|nr:stage II sporulation protein P [Lachnospiraceae bacterium]